MPLNAATGTASDRSSVAAAAAADSSASSSGKAANGQPGATPWPALIPLGHHQGKPAIPLMRPVTLVGSRRNAHLHLLSRQISKAHALIVSADGKVYIRDLASRTHVYLNGQETREADLADGDILKLGSFTFKFQAASGMKQKPRPDDTVPGQLDVDGADFPLQIDQRVMLIGRRPSCDISLVEESCSTAHAVIFSMGGKRHVRDLGSRTGTYVNGQLTRKGELQFGDEIRIGETTLRYQRSSAPASAADAAMMDEFEDLVGTAPLLGSGPEAAAAAGTAPPDVEPLDVEQAEPLPAAVVPAKTDARDPLHAIEADLSPEPAAAAAPDLDLDFDLDAEPGAGSPASPHDTALIPIAEEPKLPTTGTPTEAQARPDEPIPLALDAEADIEAAPSAAAVPVASDVPASRVRPSDAMAITSDEPTAEALAAADEGLPVDELPAVEEPLAEQPVAEHPSNVEEPAAQVEEAAAAQEPVSEEAPPAPAVAASASGLPEDDWLAPLSDEELFGTSTSPESSAAAAPEPATAAPEHGSARADELEVQPLPELQTAPEPPPLTLPSGAPPAGKRSWFGFGTPRAEYETAAAADEQAPAASVAAADPRVADPFAAPQALEEPFEISVPAAQAEPQSEQLPPEVESPPLAEPAETLDLNQLDSLAAVDESAETSEPPAASEPDAASVEPSNFEVDERTMESPADAATTAVEAHFSASTMAPEVESTVSAEARTQSGEPVSEEQAADDATAEPSEAPAAEPIDAAGSASPEAAPEAAPDAAADTAPQEIYFGDEPVDQIVDAERDHAVGDADVIGLDAAAEPDAPAEPEQSTAEPAEASVAESGHVQVIEATEPTRESALPLEAIAAPEAPAEAPAVPLGDAIADEPVAAAAEDLSDTSFRREVEEFSGDPTPGPILESQATEPPAAEVPAAEVPPAELDPSADVPVAQELIPPVPAIDETTGAAAASAPPPAQGEPVVESHSVPQLATDVVSTVSSTAAAPLPAAVLADGLLPVDLDLEPTESTSSSSLASPLVEGFTTVIEDDVELTAEAPLLAEPEPIAPPPDFEAAVADDAAAAADIEHFDDIELAIPQEQVPDATASAAVADTIPDLTEAAEQEAIAERKPPPPPPTPAVPLIPGLPLFDPGAETPTFLGGLPLVLGDLPAPPPTFGRVQVSFGDVPPPRAAIDAAREPGPFDSVTVDYDDPMPPATDAITEAPGFEQYLEEEYAAEAHDEEGAAEPSLDEAAAAAEQEPPAEPESGAQPAVDELAEAEFPLDELASDDGLPAEQLPNEEFPTEELYAAEELPAGELPSEELPAEEPASEEPATEEMAAEEFPADDLLAAEQPAEADAAADAIGEADQWAAQETELQEIELPGGDESTEAAAEVEASVEAPAQEPVAEELSIDPEMLAADDTATEPPPALPPAPAQVPARPTMRVPPPPVRRSRPQPTTEQAPVEEAPPPGFEGLSAGGFGQPAAAAGFAGLTAPPQGAADPFAQGFSADLSSDPFFGGAVKPLPSPQHEKPARKPRGPRAAPPAAPPRAAVDPEVEQMAGQLADDLGAPPVGDVPVRSTSRAPSLRAPSRPAAAPHQRLPRALAAAEPADLAPRPAFEPAHLPLQRAAGRGNRVGVLFVVMFVLMILAFALVYTFMKQRVAVSGSMTFENFGKLTVAQQRDLQDKQRALLIGENLRQVALNTFHTDHPSESPGYLGDREAFGRNENRIRWTDDGTLIYHLDDASRTDVERLRAVLKGLYALNDDARNQAGRSRVDIENTRRTVEQRQRDLEALKQQREAIKKLADSQMAPDQIAALNADKESAEKEWKKAVAAVNLAEAELKRLEQTSAAPSAGGGSGARAPTDPAAAKPDSLADTASAADPELESLQKNLEQATVRLNTIRNTAAEQAEVARKALDGALEKFQQDAESLQGIMKDNPELAAFVAAAQRLQETTHKLSGDLLALHQKTYDGLLGQKRYLDERIANRRKELWDNDAQIARLNADLVFRERGYNAAVDGGYTKEATEIKNQMDAQLGKIRERKMELEVDPTLVTFNELAAKVQQEITASQKELEAARKQDEALAREMEKNFSQIAPAVERLPENQRKVAQQMTSRIDAVANARRMYAEALEAKNSAANPPLQMIEEQVRILTGRLEDRKKALAALGNQQLTVDEQAKRQAYLEQKRMAYDALKNAETEAYNRYFEKEKTARRAIADIAAAEKAKTELDKITGELFNLRDKELPVLIANLQQKEQMAVATAYPTEPRIGEPSALPDRRPLYAMGAMAAIALVFSLLFALTGGGGAPAARRVPTMAAAAAAPDASDFPTAPRAPLDPLAGTPLPRPAGLLAEADSQQPQRAAAAI